MEGIGMTVLGGGLGMIAKYAADRVEESGEGTSKSLGEALRK
jgi:hypothetical protein